MRVWAITGGVACGKSTVCRLFEACGATVYSADADADAVRALPEVQAEMLALFGTTDRSALAQIIYNDASKRQQLNALLHPKIRARMRAVIDAAREDSKLGLVLYEVPLLFEGGLETWFDGVIAVTVAPETQIARLQARQHERGQPLLTPAEIEKRLATQLPLAEKARRADYVITTDISLAETQVQVQRIYVEITQ
jgi:dephospho-CoA kinase